MYFQNKLSEIAKLRFKTTVDKIIFINMVIISGLRSDILKEVFREQGSNYTEAYVNGLGALWHSLGALYF